VQIGIKNEAENNPEQRRKPTGKPNQNEWGEKWLKTHWFRNNET
jgi:hypothetical protein